MRCGLCKKESELLHEVNEPLIRVCEDCRQKLHTHMACICTGCNRLAWIPKTPDNVNFAAGLSGMFIDYIMDHAIFHWVYNCRFCKELSLQAEFSQGVTFH